MRLRTPEDIATLEGHVTKVDPLTNPLNRIIDHYYIHPFSIKCGLRGCGQIHKEGCLVELADRRITNIGHVCGAQFGEKFEQERRKNYETEYKPRLVQTITQAQARLNAAQFRIQEISHQARDAAYRIRDFTQMFPSLAETLKRRAIGNVSDVTESVERSKEEIDNLLEANPFQSRDALTYKEKHVGTVTGFRFPMLDWSMSTGLRKLFTELDTFSDLKPRSLSMESLQRWAHWAEDFDENLRRVVRGIKEGDSFFSTANFNLFAALAPSVGMKAQLRSLRVGDIKPRYQAAAQQSSVASPMAKQKKEQTMSLRELRALTGNKKIR